MSCNKWWLYTGVYNWQNSINRQWRTMCFIICKSYFAKIFFQNLTSFLSNESKYRIEECVAYFGVCCLHLEAYIWGYGVHPCMGAELCSPRALGQVLKKGPGLSFPMSWTSYFTSSGPSQLTVNVWVRVKHHLSLQNRLVIWDALETPSEQCEAFLRENTKCNSRMDVAV